MDIKIGRKFWSVAIVIVLVLSLLPLTSASPQGPNSVRKSGKDYVLCEPGEYCIGMPITRAVIPSNASSNRTVSSFELPELPTVSRITPEEAKKYFEEDKKIYGEPNYVSFPYGRLENVKGFEINSRNIESKKHLLTNKSKIHGVLLTNGISIYDGSANSIFKSRGVKTHGGYAWSKDVTVPVEALDDLEKSGHFIWFGLVPKEGKASKKLIENTTANPDRVFSVRIWVYDDVEEQESIPFLEPYIAGPVLPNAPRLSDGVNYYVNMTGNGVMKILEYDFVYFVVEQPYKRLIPGNYHGMPAVGTDVVYAATTGGLNGSGINISFIDTGVKTSHQDLPTPIWQYDYCDNDGTAEDLTGHGTHVTGIALGRGIRDPRFRGVAPGANLMMARWIGCSSSIGSAGQLISDLIANGANIISNSYEPIELTQEWNNAFYFDRYMYDGAPDPGGGTIHPFIIVSIGNKGTILGEPGFSKNALTVGASKIGNDGYGSYTFPGTLPTPCTDKNEPAGEVACFSNYGPTEDSNRVKPDVIAPGYNISSTALSGGYSKMWGTSFSAPYVAGIAALFMEQYPGLIDYPEVIKANIINSAIYLDGVPADKQGHGHVNALNAIYDQTGIFEASTSYGSINGNYNLSYDFTVPSGYEEVKVTLVYIDSEHGKGETKNNLDLEIYDQNGDLIGSSTSANDTVEEVKITGEPSGTWTRKIIGKKVDELVYFAEVISVRLADPDLSLTAPGTAYASPSSSFLVDTTLTNAGFTTVGSYIKLYLPSGFSINYANITRADGLVIPVPKKRLYCSSNYCRVSLGETINGYPRKVTWNITAPSTTGTYTLNFKYGALNTAEQSKSVSVVVSTIPPGTIDDFSSEDGATQSTNGGSWGDWTYYETSSSFDMDVKGSTTYGYSGAGGKLRIGNGTNPASDYVEIKKQWPGQPIDTEAGYISIYLKRQNGYPKIKLKLEDTNGYEVRTGWKSPGSTYSEKIIDLTDFQAGNPSTFDWDSVKYITIRARQDPFYNTLNDLYFDELTYTPSVPTPPTNLEVTDYSYNYISLDWDDNLRPEDVDNYKVYRYGNPIVSPSNSQYTDWGVSSSTNYCYNVTAVNSEGESTFSAGVCQHTSTPPDTDPPTVSYSTLTPPDGAVLSQDYAYIEISASETLNNADLEWNGVNESMSGSGTTWYKNKSAGDGTYSYEVWANDTANNWGVSATRNVTFDTNPPTGSILINGGDIYTTSTSVTLSLTYSADAYKVRYSNDGIWDTEPWEDPTATKPWTLTSGDGTKTVYYQINDTAGQLSSTYNDSIILDTAPPSTGVSGAPASWQNTNATAAATCSDSGSGCNSSTYRLKTYTSNPGPCPTNYSSYTLTGPQTLSSHQWVCAAAKDNAGNTGYSSSPVEFKVDKIKPITTDDAPSGWQNTNVTVTLTPTDTGGSGIADTFYCVDQANTCTPVTSGTSVLVTTEGTNYVRYYSTDNASNSENVKNATVKIDITPPTITIHSPQNTTYQINSISLNYTVYDQNGISWVGYSLDGTSNITLTGNTTLTNLSDGQHNLILHATDTAGNPESKTVYFTIKTKETEVDIISLLQTHTPKPGDTLKILLYLDNEGEIDDILRINIRGPSGTDVYQENKYIYIEDDEGRFIRLSWHIPPDAEEGRYRLTARFYDTETIPAFKTFTVNLTSIDTTPPTYSNLTPQNNSYTNDSGQDISITIQDEGSGVNASSLSMTVMGTTYYETNSGKLIYDTNSGILTYLAAESEFTDGQVVDVIAKAKDNAGNLLEVIWSFIIDLIPQINIISPPNETITDTTPDLNLTTIEPSNITYAWDGKGNITGCQNCTSYNTTYGEATPDANTSLLLHFNENTGYLAHDDSPNDNDGTILGPVWTPYGRFGNALSFDGVNDFISVPYDSSLNTANTLTFGARIYPDYDSPPSKPGPFFITKNKGYVIGIPNGEIKTFLYINGKWVGHKSSTSVPMRQWSHVFATYNGTTVKMYLNGIEVYSGPQTGDINIANTKGLKVGWCGGHKRFKGIMDDVQVLDRALNATEIAAAYNKSLKDDPHSVTVYAKDISDSQNSTTRWFTITAP